jgi:cytochrome c oxidase subunit 2
MRTGIGALVLTGCAGQQSALDPAGRGAQQIAGVFWWMVVGAAVIWLAFVALSVYSVHGAREPIQLKGTRLLIIGGGVIFPTVVLAVLLTYGLATLPEHLAAAPPGTLRIRVVGEQWWWRVQYLPKGGAPVELANEIHLPVGEPVELELESADVIHSFWVPALAGKVDMIPGRKTRLRLDPTRVGTFRGTCAEYCGASHAFMSFYVVVEAKDDFARWAREQSEPARTPAVPMARQGEELFIANGCGACHSVRGTTADGVLGPDLTHVGSRLSIAAGRLASEPDDFRRWIAHTSELKPSALMPPFGMLPAEDLQAIGAHLGQLK